MNEAFKKANETRVKQQSTASRKKLKKIKEFLKKELDNIAILSMSNDVETTVSRQEVPVLELEGSESDLASSSSKDDDFSKLESDDSARISSDSPSFEVIDEAEASISTAPEMAKFEVAASTPEMPSMVTEEKSDNLNDEKDDQQNFTIPTTVDQGTSPIPGSQFGTAHNEEDFTVQSQSSSLGFANESLDTVISIGNNREEQISNKPAERVEQIANKDTQPELVISIADEQGSKSNQKTTVSQNTKKYVVAASALAITGIALGAAVAVYLEMLAIGIAVAACCLITATVIYSYGPKSLVEDNEVKKVDDTQKSTPCCG